MKGVKVKAKNQEGCRMFVSVPVPPVTVTYLPEASLMCIKELL